MLSFSLQSSHHLLLNGKDRGFERFTRLVATRFGKLMERCPREPGGNMSDYWSIRASVLRLYTPCMGAYALVQGRRAIFQVPLHV